MERCRIGQKIEIELVEGYASMGRKGRTARAKLDYPCY